MNIVLVNMILWPAIFLIAVPLLLHLFARSRPPAYRFSSVEFILRILRTTMRVRKPQDWLVLFLRTLLFLAIIMMFLRPVFFSQRRLAGYQQKKNVVLLVDATASMAYVDGAQTRFAAACAESSEILSGLSARDFANVIWINSSPDSVFPELGSNIGYLQNALRRAKVGYEAGDISEALKRGVDMISGCEGKREICVISDFQKSTWENADIVVPDGIDLIKVKIGNEEGANGAISGITIDPALPLVAEEIAIYCDVYNYAPQPKRRTVFLEAGESRQSQDLMIPAWGKAVAIFRYTFRSPGVFPVKVALNEDGFAGDDHRTELVEVSEFLRVAVVSNGTAESAAWKRVMDAVGWAKISAVSTADLSDELPYDIIMLSGWNGDRLENIRNRLEQGCTVVCSPARDVQVKRLAELAGVVDSKQNGDAVMKWQEANQPFNVRVVGVNDAVFKIFADGAYGDPLRCSSKGRLNFQADALAGGEMLAAYGDGVPALIRFKRNGCLFLWNMPLDSRYSDWASRVEFLPFLAELVLSARPGSGVGKFEHKYPGEHVSWKIERDVLAADVVLKGPAVADIPVENSQIPSGTIFVSGGIEDMGLYTWEFRGKAMNYSIVNFPSVESDLRTMSVDAIRSDNSVAVTGGSRVRSLRDGVKLWPYLLAAGLCLMLLEGLVLICVERK